MFIKVAVLKNFVNITRKHMCRSFFDKVTGLQNCNFIKKSLQHRCFPVKFAKFLRTPFFTEHLRWLLSDSLRFPACNFTKKKDSGKHGFL